MDLQDQPVLVMGLGVHGGGLGVARWLVTQGARVTVTDLRDEHALAVPLAQLAGLPIHYRLGTHHEADFASHAIVVANPAVRRDSPWLQIARRAGARIESEMTLFFAHCRGPILGITGSKGKTTTTLLTAAMLQQQFPQTVVAGNLRISALEQLSRIDEQTPVVLELSSFQLEALGEAGLAPAFAAITTIVPDHLDRYGTMELYIDAKRQIFSHQRPEQILVLNADDPLLQQLAANAPSQLRWAGRAAPSAPGHVRLAQDGLWQADEQICKLEDIRLIGRHNQSNAAIAAALALAAGVTPANLRRALQQFTGVEHRLELVRELAGVRYINDTAATAPDAAIAALNSFETTPIVLLAGGASKRLPLAELAEAAVARAHTIVLLAGSATAELQQALLASIERSAGQAGPLLLGPFEQFAEAIQVARAHARTGDIVLLSPGCASFGMFQNEFHRGEEFRRLVGQLE